MPIRELKAKYGKSLKSKEAINRAIREEIPGGRELLDSIGALYHFRKLHPDEPNARHAQALLNKAYEEFETEIARRYDLASRREEEET